MAPGSRPCRAWSCPRILKRMLGEEVLRKRRALVVVALPVRPRADCAGRVARGRTHRGRRVLSESRSSIKRTASLANWVLENASALRTVGPSFPPDCNPAPGSQLVVSHATHVDRGSFGRNPSSGVEPIVPFADDEGIIAGLSCQQTGQHLSQHSSPMLDWFFASLQTLSSSNGARSSASPGWPHRPPH